jgi:hypothetical protein
VEPDPAAQVRRKESDRRPLNQPAEIVSAGGGWLVEVSDIVKRSMMKAKARFEASSWSAIQNQ